MDLVIEIAKEHSSCFPFILFSWKSAIYVLNSRMKLTTNIWKDANYIRILRTRITIEETVHFLAVTMQIQNESYFTLFANILDKCLDRPDFWTIYIFLTCVPFSIQVLAWKIGPIMSEDNSVGINNWYHIDNIIFKQ